jgi:hypothetical protein
MANRMAKKGWEMVTAAGAGWGAGMATGYKMTWCFKRAPQ